MKIILDTIFSLFSLILFFPLLILIYFVLLLDIGTPLFIQKRVGLNLKNFSLIKFRTMKIGTLSTGTHLINSSNITRFGYLLRKFKFLYYCHSLLVEKYIFKESAYILINFQPGFALNLTYSYFSKKSFVNSPSKVYFEF